QGLGGGAKFWTGDGVDQHADSDVVKDKGRSSQHVAGREDPGISQQAKQQMTREQTDTTEQDNGGKTKTAQQGRLALKQNDLENHSDGLNRPNPGPRHPGIFEIGRRIE